MPVHRVRARGVGDHRLARGRPSVLGPLFDEARSRWRTRRAPARVAAWACMAALLYAAHGGATPGGEALAGEGASTARADADPTAAPEAGPGAKRVGKAPDRMGAEPRAEGEARPDRLPPPGSWATYVLTIGPSTSPIAAGMGGARDRTRPLPGNQSLEFSLRVEALADGKATVRTQWETAHGVMRPPPRAIDLSGLTRGPSWPIQPAERVSHTIGGRSIEATRYRHQAGAGPHHRRFEVDRSEAVPFGLVRLEIREAGPLAGLAPAWTTATVDPEATESDAETSKAKTKTKDGPAKDQEQKESEKDEASSEAAKPGDAPGAEATLVLRVLLKNFGRDPAPTKPPALTAPPSAAPTPAARAASGDAP